MSMMLLPFLAVFACSAAVIFARALLLAIGQPKPQPNGKPLLWVSWYYAGMIFFLTLLLGILLLTFYAPMTEFLYSMSFIAPLLMITRLLVLGLLVFFAVTILMMLSKKQPVHRMLWSGAGLALLITILARGYAIFLQVSFFLIPLLLIFTIFRLYKQAKAKRPMPNLLVSGVIFVVMAMTFWATADQYNVVVKQENYITDITYKYNKDGSIRYDEDGNKELKTSWDRRSFRSAGFNPLPLIGAAGCYGCLIYMLVSMSKAPAAQGNNAAAPETKAGTQTGAKTGTKTTAKAPAKPKLPSAGEQEKARRAAMQKAQAEKKDENDPT